MNFQMNKLLQQAQKMQKAMQDAQEEMAKVEIVGESGAGLVKVIMNGHHRVVRIELSPAIRNEDLEIEADLIVAAINDASRKVSETSKEKITSLTSGLKLPEGFNLEDFK